MASLIKIGKGKSPSRAVQFTDREGTRKTIRLGKVGYEAAVEFKRKIERLLAWSITNEVPDPQAATWLQGLPDPMHAKLAKVGLVNPREPAPTAPLLGKWVDKYLDSRTDLKPSSIRTTQLAHRYLKEYFGADLPIDRITPNAAKDWRIWLKQGKGQAESSVRLHCRLAKRSFNEAVERELIPRSPFRKLVGASVAAPRDRYFTPEETDLVLGACHNIQWRLLVGLARLAGLRTPSETHLLTWGDVDWDRGRLSARSPKTERYKGHERRIVPITPRLTAILQEAFDLAEEGEERIITMSRYGLQKGLSRIVKRAGIAPFKRPFRVLRQSCATEWKGVFPEHAVNTWLGHSEEVSNKHYMMITEDIWQRAACLNSESAAECAAVSPCTALHSVAGGLSRRSGKAQETHKKGVFAESGNLLAATRDSPGR